MSWLFGPSPAKILEKALFNLKVRLLRHPRCRQPRGEHRRKADAPEMDADGRQADGAHVQEVGEEREGGEEEGVSALCPPSTCARRSARAQVKECLVKGEMWSGRAGSRGAGAHPRFRRQPGGCTGARRERDPGEAPGAAVPQNLGAAGRGCAAGADGHHDEQRVECDGDRR